MIGAPFLHRRSATASLSCQNDLETAFFLLKTVFGPAGIFTQCNLWCKMIRAHPEAHRT
jgi:hypothetical protein